MKDQVTNKRNEKEKNRQMKSQHKMRKKKECHECIKNIYMI